MGGYSALQCANAESSMACSMTFSRYHTLDPENESVTLATLTRAARAVGRQLRLELV